MTPIPHHLPAVWNPSYASDALDTTVGLLRTAVASHRAGGTDEEDIYVWWSEVRSSNRRQALPHLEAVLALDAQLRGPNGPSSEMHLYLTDYQSLCIAHIGEITSDDVAAEDPDAVPDAPVALRGFIYSVGAIVHVDSGNIDFAIAEPF